MAERKVSTGTIVQGSLLRFYVHQDHHHHGKRFWEWILEQGNKLGIRGGSAFQAKAGFGQHHLIHGSNSLDLVDASTVQVEFVVSHDEACRLLDALSASRVRLTYAYAPVSFGVVSSDSPDPPIVSIRH